MTNSNSQFIRKRMGIMSNWNYEELKKEMDDYFNNVSREQFISDLKEAGFDVTEGEKGVIYEDED